MPTGIEKRVVLVTGASKGIGFACIRHFVDEGCEVHLVSRHRFGLDRAAESLGRHVAARVHAHSSDFGNPEARKKLVDVVGHIDVVVNNAGAIPGGVLDQVSEEVWRNSWELKLFGYIHLTKLVLPRMIAAG
jgi:3-oxoacyl-[acyl-carrier protein] reductase